MDYNGKMRRYHEYVEALEEEKRKILVFQRELPLCLELVTQAIEMCRRELSGTTTEYNMHGQLEFSDQTSRGTPVLEEFIPLKRTSSEDDNVEQHSHGPLDNNYNLIDKKKSDWLRSVQLWNQSPDPPSKEDVPRKEMAVEVKRNSGAFQPFHREKSEGKADKKANPSVPTAATCSTTETISTRSGGDGGGGGGVSNKRDAKEGQTQRKQRRCWSPELHRRFLQALQQLGGSHAATPKQIRELLKVDGLTNDEVKSHLQKYRLHTRRSSPKTHNNANPQTPQFVVVGGIWVPPPGYAAMATKASSGEAVTVVAGTNGIYAPVAAPPPAIFRSSAAASVIQRSQQTQSEQLQPEERGSHREGAWHSDSPSTCSSTHTTTSCPCVSQGGNM